MGFAGGNADALSTAGGGLWQAVRLSIATMAAWKTEGLIGKGSFFGIGTQASERVQRKVSDAGGKSLYVGFGLRHWRAEAVDEDTPVIEVDAKPDDVMREHLALHVGLRLAQNGGDDAMQLLMEWPHHELQKLTQTGRRLPHLMRHKLAEHGV
jgi:hypothetical protein